MPGFNQSQLEALTGFIVGRRVDKASAAHRWSIVDGELGKRIELGMPASSLLSALRIVGEPLT